MSKKSKIAIKLNEDLVAIDEELDAALDGLDGVNSRILNVLTDIEEGTFDQRVGEESTEGEAESEATESAEAAVGEAAVEEVDTEVDEADDEFDDEEDEFDDDEDDDEDDS